MSQQLRDRLTVNFGHRAASVRANLLRVLLELFTKPGRWHEANMTQFTNAAVPHVTTAQRTIAQLTIAYLELFLSDLLSNRQRLNVDLAEFTALRGVDPLDVYERPYRQIWKDLSGGATLEDAVDAGAFRLTQIAATDMQLAKTHSSRKVLSQQTRIAGYRRVLNGPENCALCILTSTQRYSTGQLEPIHPGCDCGIEPIESNNSVPQVLDEDRLKAAHDAIAERFGAEVAGRTGRDIDYRKVILVREHSEIGPVLTVARHRFTSQNA